MAKEQKYLDPWRTALVALHRICLNMDADHEATRPSEEQYQEAMASAEAALAGPLPMRVYAITASGDCCGGMAVVVAHNEQEAKSVARTIEVYGWRMTYNHPDSIESFPCRCHGEPRALTHYEMGE